MSLVQMQFSDAYDFPDAPSGSFAAQIISPKVEVNNKVVSLALSYPPAPINQ